MITGENVFYMVIGCVGAVILVIAVLVVVYFRSTRKQLPSAVLPNNIQQRYPSITRSPDFTAQTRPLFNSEASASILDFETKEDVKYFHSPEKNLKNSLYSASSASKQPDNTHSIINERSHSVDITAALVELYADRNLFQILPIHELEGTFGELKWALWHQNANDESGDVDDEEDNASADEAVIVKTLKPNADKRHFFKFLEQALVFHHVPPFTHLAQVAAAASYGRFDCPETVTDFPLICYKHQGFGNLKSFLQRCRCGNVEAMMHKTNDQSCILGGKPVQTLRTHELVSMAIQINKAMNCLVSEIGRGSDRLLVQLCDTALSKDLFPSDYHCLGDNENRPVKWMAYESLQKNIFNSATDAWSFGVTLWELLSCAQQPYVDVDPDEMILILEQGQRLVQPYNCPDDLYNVMYCCWQLDYRDRPTPQQLLIALQDFTIQLRQFI
ncbi:unnamed protein product [Anisakis simplex]|uniref:Tyrosine-protein kinase RYK (inferred by orthology to a human protein) n=1 Tax=Anisakis simplex TaxID=6269 RepID=A0A0M3KB60_ANISI|nr:unnamed protein product [Anisakis simplex]